MTSEPRILVVEDEILVAEHIRYRLQDAGFVVLGVATTGSRALQAVQETSPDVVLMDVRLAGEISGVEAADQIYERFGIPVVFLTAYASESLLQRVERSPHFACVLKPFHISALRRAFQDVLGASPFTRR